MTDEVYLLLGTNLGDRAANLEIAISNLRDNIGKINKLSRIYETAAWGKTNQPAFYNQVVSLTTNFPPQILLKRLLAIEAKMGRQRLEKWGERLIDIDILFIGKQIIDSIELQVPHPEIHNRRFTLEPLVEIAPDFLHPILKQTVTEILNNCSDQLDVQPLNQSKL